MRLFTPVGSNLTDVWVFVPGSNGTPPATVRGFGAVFTDVDAPDGLTPPGASTRLEYFDAAGQLLFSGIVPASPGDGTLSFFGIMVDDARIARVRITTGTVAPGPDDDAQHGIVMMDDFFYGEPQPLAVHEEGTGAIRRWPYARSQGLVVHRKAQTPGPGVGCGATGTGTWGHAPSLLVGVAWPHRAVGCHLPKTLEVWDKKANKETPMKSAFEIPILRYRAVRRTPVCPINGNRVSCYGENHE